MPGDYGDYMEVTSAITGRRVLINKLAIMYVNEPPNEGGATDIWFDRAMYVPAKESYDEILEMLLSEDENELDD